jgi:molybdopterin/thiamine biosynthesis adenylyltransferase
MMGIGCGKDGIVFVSDMSSIKKSDLNRQFLFRLLDIGVSSCVCLWRTVEDTSFTDLSRKRSH